jgi:hypothetical protein
VYLFDIYDYLLILLGFAVVGIVIFAQVVLKELQMAKLLALAAKRLGGRVVGKGMGHPELRIEQASMTGVIKFIEVSKPIKKHFTVLTYDVKLASPFSLHLITQDTQAVLAPHFSGDPVQLDDPALNQEYAIRSSDLPRARLMLSKDAPQALTRLRQIHPEHQLEILVYGRELTIQLPTYLKQANQVLGLGFMGEKLLKRFLAASGFGGAMSQDSDEQPDCIVCGKSLDAQIRRCTYCDSQWHADCAPSAENCPQCGAPTAGVRES